MVFGKQLNLVIMNDSSVMPLRPLLGIGPGAQRCLSGVVETWKK
jgi:hypothetical protein